jgi:hypothetical protein
MTGRITAAPFDVGIGKAQKIRMMGQIIGLWPSHGRLNPVDEAGACDGD